MDFFQIVGMEDLTYILTGEHNQMMNSYHSPNSYTLFFCIVRRKAYPSKNLFKKNTDTDIDKNWDLIPKVKFMLKEVPL